jgi:hypothetical protein
MAMTVPELRRRLEVLCETASHVVVSVGDQIVAFHVERGDDDRVRFGTSPEEELAFEALLGSLGSDVGSVICRAVTGEDASGEPLQETRGYTSQDGEVWPMPRNLLFWAEHTGPHGEPLPPESGVTITSDTDEEPVLDLGGFDHEGAAQAFAETLGTPRGEGCPFHARIVLDDEDRGALGADERELFDLLGSIRERMPLHTGLGRCADSLLAHRMMRLAEGFDALAWGDDDEADERLLARCRPLLEEGMTLEEVDGEARERMSSSLIDLDDLATRRTILKEGEWVRVAARGLRGVTDSDLRRLPRVPLPSPCTFLDLEDDDGHPWAFGPSEEEFHVHGAFVSLVEGAVAVTTVASMYPDDGPHALRRALACVAFGHGDEPEGLDCDVYVDCQRGIVSLRWSNEIMESTLFGMGVDDAQDIAERVVKTLLDRNRPPAPPRGRRGGKRSRR